MTTRTAAAGLLLALLVATTALRILAGPSQGNAGTPTAPLAESSAERDQRMRWWREARFGMFIHWGLYAVPAGDRPRHARQGHRRVDHVQGEYPAGRVREVRAAVQPDRFDAAEWVRIAKDAGMKYIVITCKHHDGFSCSTAMSASYDIVDATPYGKD